MIVNIQYIITDIVVYILYIWYLTFLLNGKSRVVLLFCGVIRRMQINVLLMPQREKMTRNLLNKKPNRSLLLLTQCNIDFCGRHMICVPSPVVRSNVPFLFPPYVTPLVVRSNGRLSKRRIIRLPVPLTTPESAMVRTYFPFPLKWLARCLCLCPAATTKATRSVWREGRCRRRERNESVTVKKESPP